MSKNINFASCFFLLPSSFFSFLLSSLCFLFFLLFFLFFCVWFFLIFLLSTLVSQYNTSFVRTPLGFSYCHGKKAIEAQKRRTKILLRIAVNGGLIHVKEEKWPGCNRFKEEQV